MKHHEERRADPDALLAMIKEEEKYVGKGRLRIFLGMAPGVGKTYAMLESAHKKQSEGVDTLVGIVETHKRAETEALLANVPVLPRCLVHYKNHTIEEFDLDAALTRHPALILVDELAHTNAPGSRHEKRWQDVVELLDNGIDVWSAMNVQHMESLNDVVAQITGVRVRETVPDSLLEAAESVILVDLPPDDLLQRLKEGKVYIPQQAERAAKNFFRRGNLTALRELALRATAQRVNTEVLVYRHGQSIHTTWPTSERILVCVGPSPSSATLIRAAKRLATSLHAPWLALYVHTVTSDNQRDSAFRNLRLAEELGGETHVLSGHSVATETVAFARQQNITKIVVGKPMRRSWRDHIVGSPVDKLILLSEEIDVYIIRGDTQKALPQPQRKPRPLCMPWKQYALALGVMALCTALCFAMYPYFERSNLIMVYLCGVMGTAVWLDRKAAILASVVSVLAFDVCFVPPLYSIAISDIHYLVTFGVMLVVALVLSSMASQIKRQAENARFLERQSAALASLSRELVSTRGETNLLAVAQKHLLDVFAQHTCFLLPDTTGNLNIRLKPTGVTSLPSKEQGVAQWVQTNGKPAGKGTPTLPDSTYMFIPLLGAHNVAGVIGLKAVLANDDSLKYPDQQRLLEAFAGQIARALEMDRLENAARVTLMDMESEKTRSALVSAVTHDFQTPLAAIAGSAESILLLNKANQPGKIANLAENIHREAARLSQLVTNLLRIAKLKSANFKLNQEVMPIEDVAGSALTRLESLLEGHSVTTSFPPDLPMAAVDEVLLEQLFMNLLENAVKHTPPGTAIIMAASVVDGHLQVEVRDNGPGVPEQELEHLFEHFYRGANTTHSQGYGLGLAICHLIAKAHQGSLCAENNAQGGLRFVLCLPLTPLIPFPA